VIKLDPGNIPAHRYRAFADLQAGSYDNAVNDYNVVLKEKEDVAILDRRAFAYWNMKQYDKSLADYDKIIKQKPNDKDGYLNRSYVYELMGDFQKSMVDVDKVLSLDPSNADAKTRKGRLEYQLKKSQATPTPSPRPRRTLPPDTPRPKHP